MKKKKPDKPKKKVQKRKQTHSLYQGVAGVKYMDQVQDDFRAGPGGRIYIGDGMWVYPNGEMWTDDPGR